MNAVTCDNCTAEIVKENGMAGVGYGVTPDGKKHCYACCAEMDRATMTRDGRITLYLTGSPARRADKVTNWPGSLSFRVLWWKEGRAGFGGKSVSAYFEGPDGALWLARNQGADWNQIARCQRLSAASARRHNWK